MDMSKDWPSQLQLGIAHAKLFVHMPIHMRIGKAILSCEACQFKNHLLDPLTTNSKFQERSMHQNPCDIDHTNSKVLGTHKEYPGIPHSPISSNQILTCKNVLQQNLFVWTMQELIVFIAHWNQVSKCKQTPTFQFFCKRTKKIKYDCFLEYSWW